ncbi:MAG TPA: hypothetical protein VKV39_16130 [Candidatus Sulfotelmatobacter sp.]|nr:hypothetical protein [Candidatus Sulfotelmatobacter sp.]
MLVFESLSAGAIAIGIGLASVLIVIGLYSVVVWPLTFWDMASLGLEKYSSWTNTILWSIFAGGSLAGYWCFSGAAFRDRSKNKRSAPGRSPR